MATFSETITIVMALASSQPMPTLALRLVKPALLPATCAKMPLSAQCVHWETTYGSTTYVTLLAWKGTTLTQTN